MLLIHFISIFFSEKLDERIKDNLKAMLDDGSLRAFSKSNIYRSRIKHTSLFNLDSDYFKEKEYPLTVEESNSINRSEQMFKSKSS